MGVSETPRGTREDVRRKGLVFRALPTDVGQDGRYGTGIEAGSHGGDEVVDLADVVDVRGEGAFEIGATAEEVPGEPGPSPTAMLAVEAERHGIRVEEVREGRIGIEGVRFPVEPHDAVLADERHEAARGARLGQLASDAVGRELVAAERDLPSRIEGAGVEDPALEIVTNVQAQAGREDQIGLRSDLPGVTERHLEEIRRHLLRQDPVNG